MDIQSVILSIGQVIVLGAFFFWVVRKNTAKIDKILIDVAEMKQWYEQTKTDHDRLIVLETLQQRTEKDLHNLNMQLSIVN